MSSRSPNGMTPHTSSGVWSARLPSKSAAGQSSRARIISDRVLAVSLPMWITRYHHAGALLVSRSNCLVLRSMPLTALSSRNGPAPSVVCVVVLTSTASPY